MIWLAKLKDYALAILGALGAAAIAVLTVDLEMTQHEKKRAEAERDQAKQEAAISQANEQHQAEVAHATETTQREVDQMPDAGTQQVGAAQPGTAAGWLRDNANRSAKADD